MQRNFLNVENMRIVVQDLESRMTQRHWQSVDVAPRIIVLDIMKDVDMAPDMQNMSLDDKNDFVLQRSWEIVSDMTEAKELETREQHPQVPQAVEPPPRHLPTIAEPERFQSSPPALVDESEDYKFNSVPEANPESRAAAAEFVDKIVKQPWAPQARPSDVVVHVSVDGFDRDTDLYPGRFRFQYICGDVRNVTKLKATYLNIPVDAGDTTMKLGIPYVLVTFDEFSATFNDGSGNAVKRSFAKFVLHKINGFPGARSFARLLPQGGGEREFTPPIANMNRLTVSISSPDGGLISIAEDTHRIVNVFLNNDAMANWILRTAQVWRTDFQAGDLVRITGANSASSKVNDFLNRPEGHTIIATGELVDVIGQFSSIVIARPYRQDPVTRRMIFDEETQAAVQALNPPGADPYGNDVVDGMDAKILNVSLQPSLSLEATCAPSVRHEAVV
jgi:hypothetical protein